eukprot:CAMPEP_0204553364 /NCGR_PEP_ID=MMETSP0661-20131031/27280_1 /ASSEMBLY_ACC=CAM_ASM_000606 /TAXON_ID=109239 /ORGANISM="Alexandrium margalefi, Strain AMGDE01CS-322" /LENGTH=272 /DNA_ID=CAMNT_0051560401 /DNA_START=91 /DNA_END=905 /DNA_ORIENTATION=+
MAAVQDQEAALQDVLRAPAGLQLGALARSEAVLASLQRNDLRALRAKAYPEVQGRLHDVLEKRVLDALAIHVVEPIGGGQGRVGALRDLLPADDESPHHLVENLAALRRRHHAGAEDVLVLHLLLGALLVQKVEDAQPDDPELVADELRGRRAAQQAPRALPLHAPLHDLVVRPPHRLKGHVGELSHDLGLGQAHVLRAGLGAAACDGAPDPLALLGAFGDHDLRALAGGPHSLAHQTVLVRREEVENLPQLLALAVRITARLVEAELLHLL